ncbi:MAG TPA: DUF4038 domain-containing protein [Candidatus Angelobacter sp.]|nr:DUF4038 domain-containing protein [Candidatus Angelobacter sp.]
MNVLKQALVIPLAAGLFAHLASAAGAPVYPVKPGPGGRCLVDQNNTPFLLIGDSPQALIVNISEAEADAFFADRSAHGFNSVWINLLCANYTGGRTNASTFDGIVPFTGTIPSKTSYDLTMTNEAYFARVDRILNLAARHGIQVLLDPAETGSFLSVMRDNGTNKCRAYGQFLGNRYQSFPNIIWMSGNDFQSWRTAGDDAVVLAVALGIRDNDTRHLHTTELDYLVSSSLDDTNWNSVLGLNATYTYFPTYARLLQDYNRPNPLPTFLVEANYEFENLQGPVTTAPILRKQEYWTMTSGACGQMYGNGYTWPFKSGWQGNLDTPGATQIGYLKQFFEARAWHLLVPDTNHTIVTSGYGTFASTGHVSDNDYLTAARTPDGSLIVIYTPVVRQFTVDMSRSGAAATTRWFDPSSGTFVPISGSPFANSGTRDFTPPGNNTDGDGGWVLVLETNPPPDPPPPPPQPKFVQQNYATPQTPQTQVSVLYPNAQTAGNANILAIGWNDTNAFINAVSDSAGNVYQGAVPLFRGDGMSQAVYFAVNIPGGTNAVTVAFDRPAAFIDLRVTEYSGLRRTNVVDAGSSAAGIGASADSGSLNTTSTNDLLFAAGMTATTFTAPGSGFTQRVITLPDADIVADKVSAAVGAYNASATLSSGAWLMQLAAFKPALPPDAPVLRAFLTSSNTVAISWPSSSAGFILQSADSFSAANWLPATELVGTNNSQFETLVLLSRTERYFRLLKP